MALDATVYCDLDDLKDWLRISDNNDDAILQYCISAASRSVDSYCGRRFYRDTTATSKDFYATFCGDADINDYVVASGETVTVDLTGSGTFGTAWTSGTQYMVAPLNREQHGISPWPGETLISLQGYYFPTSYTGRPTVRVSATWGWAAIPDAVRQATLIKATRIFRRQQSPEGVAGGGDFGGIRISQYEDPTVVELLAPFRRGGFAAGLVVA